MKHSIAILLIIFVTAVSKAQDPLLNQSNAAAIYTNPAFTSIQKGWLAHLSHRNQWPAIQGTYVTTLAGAQKRFEKGKWGIGLNVLQDNAGSGTLMTTGLNLAFSKHFTLKSNSLSIGIQSSYVQKALDWNKLNFGDQIDQQLGFVSQTSENPIGIENRSVFSFSAGAIFSGKWGNIGAATHHINQPIVASSTVPLLPLKFTGHGTYQMQFGGIGAAVTSIFKAQRDFTQFTNYATVSYLWFKVMSGYTLNDAVLLGTGINLKNRISLLYLREITVSKLAPNTGGSHEISLRYRFGAKGDYKDKFTFAF